MIMTQPMPAWKVTGQAENTQIGPSGTFAHGVTVTFQTAKGVTGSVFVADTQYTADNVKQLINDYVTHLDAVADLTADAE